MNNQSRSNQNDELPSIPPPLPPFRSVSMMSAPPPMPLKQSFTQGKQQHQTLHKAPLLKSQSTPMENPAAQWTWRVAHVPAVPLYHPLERTAFTTTEAVDTITGRVSSFLKANSIQSSYQEEAARVSCSTDYCLFFTVQLWKKNDSTVVEVQRKQGCAIAMQSLRQQLKNCIIQNASVAPRVATNAPERACAFLQQLPVAEQPKGDSAEDCLTMCLQFLESPFLDQNRLGLEALCSMTDSTKVLKKDASETCRTILQDSKMQSLLLKFIKKEELLQLGHAERMHGTMHLLALKALAQALESKDADVGSLDDSVFWQAVVPALYENIQLVNHKPMEAALSIRCLRLLQIMHPTSMQLQHQAMT
eukprot:scaffold3123_cov119-Cylindrotheca_fusiformis.AAC.1